MRRRLCSFDDELNYRELQKRVESLDYSLCHPGKGSVIGVDVDDTWLLFLMLHACSGFGWALLPVTTGQSRSRRDNLLRQCGCHLVVSTDKPADLPNDVHWLSAAQLIQQGTEGRPSSRSLVSNPDPDEILLMVPTSGTTGDPKGVMLSRRNLEASARQVNLELDLHVGDYWLDCLPLQHIAGLSIVCRCVLAGATVVLHRGFDAGQVWRDLAAHRITHLSLVPAMLYRLLEVAEGRHPPASLRCVVIGGAALNSSLAMQAHQGGWPLVVSYGMSETASMCVLDRDPHAGLVSDRVGRPLKDFRLELSEGKRGRIRVAGDAVMTGYANLDLSPGEGLDNDWFETGDLGYWDEEGRLCVSGRMDELLNSAGRLLHPREVERLLEVCLDIGEVGVCSQPDPVWGDCLVAVYTGVIDACSLETWARAHLPSGLRPRKYRRTDTLPLNRMGKLDRQHLQRGISEAGWKEA